MTAEKKKVSAFGAILPYHEGSERIISREIPVYRGDDIVVDSTDERDAADLIVKLSEDRGCAVRLHGHDRSGDEQVSLFRVIYRALGSGGCTEPVIAVIPSVVLPSEADQVRKWAADARESLRAENKPFGRLTAGIAVETPSGAILADLLAPMADFFVFDSAALLHSLEAGCGGRISDRPMHESVERCLKMVVSAARREGISVVISKK